MDRVSRYGWAERLGASVTVLAAALILWLPAGALADEAQQVTAIEAWLQAFNQGSEAMAKVRRKHYADVESAAWRPQFEQMRSQLSPLVLEGLLATGGPSMEALVDSADGPLTLSFEFDARDRIVGLQIEMGHPGASNLPTLELPDDPHQQAPVLDRYIEDLVADDIFSGTVVIARPSGKVFYRGAFGLASREYGVANTMTTRFDVGSINKDYTHLALLLLAVEGTLDLGATVGRYLPSFPQERVRKEVTIQQLIDHRGGVADYFDGQWGSTPMRTLRTIDDYLPLWADRPLIAEPGEREHYSNFGYTILGAVIEAVSGMAYPEFVQRRIFDVVGMSETGFFAVDAITPNVATGYTQMGPDYESTEELWKNIYLEPAVGGPWGKSYSPAEDLLAFYQMLFRHQLIAEGKGWFGDGPIEGFGIALGGGGPGLSAMMALENGWMVIALANLDTPAADELAQVLIRAVQDLE